MYDKELGGPTLTVFGEVFTSVGTSPFQVQFLPNPLYFLSISELDFKAVEQSHRNRWKERQRAIWIARLKSLFTFPRCINASKCPENPESALDE